MIRIFEFSKPYVSDYLSIEIPNGITYLKGKNGVGKTTLLDCIAGIDKKYSGQIDGNHNVIYLNQNLYFYGRLKVRDLVQFLLGLNGISNYQTYFESHIRLSKKKHMIINMFEKPVGKLSGGELKLLYFSIITSLERAWYLFDEPFAQIDTEGKDDIWNVFQMLTSEKKNIIVTSHEEVFLQSIPGICIIDMDILQHKGY